MKIFGLVLCIFLGQFAEAQKIGANFGYYDIQARSQNMGQIVSLSLARLGNYQLTGQFGVTHFLDLGVGYSIFYSRTLGGDMGFGPDIFLNYFPFSRNGNQHWSERGIQLSLHETIRPYLGIAFHQRQFQSVQTSYSGFGLQGGLEWAQSHEWGYHFKASFQNLIGPSSLNFRFMDISFGLQYYLD
jgi:hypothetical protein